MSRKKTSQAEPTAPAATDAAGYAIDEWKLPLSGPRRAARLAELKKRDPREFPEDWGAKAEPPAPSSASEGE